ncbi:hypothetical protein PIB30_044767 [Stylosanthes scabra]|uniref:RRM domain-containing protein n=1 Tax=Stylosanthes scabra TaxID=79078 RepID=A0ABU6QFC5_9FABA|nr:hypothetical protein [Stylosanthes scabra]
MDSFVSARIFRRVLHERGVSRIVSVRGKHCEEGNNSGRRNKGESDGRNRENDGIHDKWIVIDRSTHSAFVDNLPIHITKRFLFREFGFHGNVVDAFVSRERRQGNKCVFAFIRFDSKGGAVRVIENLDGSYIAGKGMIVKEAHVRRNRVNGFGLVVETSDKLEEQYGKIECRDLGSQKCILLMDTIELRHKALADAIFLEIFDEVREYQGFKWAH